MHIANKIIIANQNNLNNLQDIDTTVIHNDHLHLHSYFLGQYDYAVVLHKNVIVIIRTIISSYHHPPRQLILHCQYILVSMLVLHSDQGKGLAH